MGCAEFKRPLAVAACPRPVKYHVSSGTSTITAARKAILSLKIATDPGCLQCEVELERYTQA